MGFLYGQNTLTTLDWILRAIIAFFFLITIAKLLGQRAISQLRLLDFVISIVIGNIIAHPLSDERLGLNSSIITTLVLVILYLGGVFATLKFPPIGRFINNSPITVVKNGDILLEGLKKSRITLDLLLEELRKEKVDDIKKVALATFEPDGRISVFLDPKYEAVTPSSLKIKTEAFNLPITIIKEGKLNLKELKELHKDEEWVVHKLQSLYTTDVKNVLLATLDNNDNLKVFLYM